MNKQYYTAGEIARIAGVSLRTIRFYDTKGLLPPISHSQSGYRYYDKSSVALLQRILMLKYLGFSLEQIQQLIAAQEADSLDQETILAQQKSLLLERKKQLELLKMIQDKLSREGAMFIHKSTGMFICRK